MSIFEELEADQFSRSDGCGLCVWLASRQDRDEWEKALAQPKSRFTTASIYRLMKKNGFTLGPNVVQKHRQAGHHS